MILWLRTSVAGVLALALLALFGPADAKPWRAPAGASSGKLFDYWFVTNQDFLDVAFPDDKTGYVVTRSGNILKTEDGGQSWAAKSSELNRLRGIAFVDAKRGWAVGTDGYIVHTADGGETWQPQTSPTKETLIAVRFKDGPMGWAVGESGTILRTTDGGKSWSAVKSPSDQRLHAVAFVDRDYGWAAGTEGAVLYTSDGGATWQERSISGGDDLFAIDFANQTRGVAVGKSGRLFFTNDGGRTWTGVTLNQQVTLYSVQLSDANRGWVAGASGYLFQFEFQSDGTLKWNSVQSGTMAALRKVVTRGTLAWAVGAEGTVTARTASGDWALRLGKAPTRRLLNAVVWRSEREGWIATADGMLLSTQDRGATWNAVSVPWPANVAIAERSLNAIVFAKERGWTVGSKGAIFSTADGGKTWSRQESQVEGNLLSVAATSDRAAWAVGVGGTIVRTVDGTRWTRVESGQNSLLTSVFFLDQNRGWIAGHGGTILSTTDGASWSRRSRDMNVKLQSIFMLDASHGWAVGSSGTVLFSKDGVRWERLNSRTIGRATLSGVQFVSPTKGWAVDNQGVVHATDDGGQNWAVRRMPNRAKMTSLFLLNPEFGTAVGLNTIAQLTWRALPPLQEFDAVNTNDAVNITGTIAPTQLRISVKQIEYKADKADEFQAISKSERPVVNGKFDFEWTPRSQGFRDGTSFTYRVVLTDGLYEYTQPVDTVFVYKSWWGKFEEEHPYLLYIVALTVGALLILLIPHVLFTVYRFLPWKAASDQFSSTTLGKVASAAASLVVIPYYFKLPWIVRAWAKRYAANKLQFSDLGPDLRAYYLKRPAVLDAWVARNVRRATEYQKSVLEQISKNSIYIPMPISLDGDPSHAPVREEFDWLAGDQDVSLIITGAGGSGKSTFAVQLMRWALQGLGPANTGAMIPVFIQTPTKDLMASIKEVLKPIVHEDDLDDALLASVVRRKRILVVIDSLSEWGDAERSYVEGIRGKVAVGALVITSRRPVEGSKHRQVTISKLDASAMFAFREKYLANLNLPVSPEFAEALDHGLVDMKNRWFDGAEPTCLLVRMYIDDAVANALTTPDQLANNAPEVIIRYVQRLTGVATGDFVVRIAKEAAKDMLSPEFVPQPVTMSSLQGKLTDRFKDQPIKEGLEKLIESGIMSTNFVAGSTQLRFVHDPVAEFLASIQYCEQYKNEDSSQWTLFVNKIKAAEQQASGFVLALQTSLASYRQALKLPDFMKFA